MTHESDQAALDAAAAILAGAVKTPSTSTSTSRSGAARVVAAWPRPPLAVVVAVAVVAAFLVGVIVGTRPGLSVPPASVLAGGIGTLVAFVAGVAAGRETTGTSNVEHLNARRPVLNELDGDESEGTVRRPV